MHDRPASYRLETWSAISSRLNSCSLAELQQLAIDMPNASEPEQSTDPSALITRLLKNGSYLLPKLGLTKTIEIMRGTVFSHGDVEFILSEDNARDLANETPSISVKRIGEVKTHTFKYQDLMRALLESPDFDQLERW